MGSNYQRGIVLYQTKQFKHAEKEFRHELTNDPNSSAAHAMLGMTLTALGKGEQGHKEALESVRLLPSYSYAHYTLSFTFAALRRIKDAEKAILEAIRLDPCETYLLSRGSQIYFLQGQYEKALQLADVGLQFDAQDADCLVNKGAALIELNRLSDANEVFDAALRIAPESYLVHLNVGALRLRQGNQPRAFEHYRESLRLNATSEKARAGVVESLKARNPFYHFLLKFSIWCRKLPKPVLASCLILLLVPGIRYLIVAVLVLYGIADYCFDLALRLDPTSRDFVKQVKQPVERAYNIRRGVWSAVACALVSAGIFAGFYRGAKNDESNQQPTPTTFQDYSSYMNYIQKRIKHNWYPQHLKKSDKVVVEFEVNRNGSVKGIKIIQSSGDKYSDQAAIQAVKWATPLPALPAGTKDPSVKVHFDFKYNVATK